MQLLYFLCFCLPYAVAAVNSLKPLTESMGQEVIEMDAPVKELPSDIEEEPSAEKDADVKTSATVQPATKITVGESRRKLKTSDRTRNPQEEEEARIEKELSELYKDSDYKADSAEISKEQPQTTTETTTLPSTTAEDADKPIARIRNEFRFQPESNNKADIERFRTSVDVISCDKKRLSGTTIMPSSSGEQFKMNETVLLAAIFKSLLSHLFLVISI